MTITPGLRPYLWEPLLEPVGSLLLEWLRVRSWVFFNRPAAPLLPLLKVSAPLRSPQDVSCFHGCKSFHGMSEVALVPVTQAASPVAAADKMPRAQNQVLRVDSVRNRVPSLLRAFSDLPVHSHVL